MSKISISFLDIPNWVYISGSGNNINLLNKLTKGIIRDLMIIYYKVRIIEDLKSFKVLLFIIILFLTLILFKINS
jgi:hypothetical protein